MVLLGLGIGAIIALIVVAVLAIAAVLYISSTTEGYIANEPICHDMSRIYGIKSGQSFGTAPPHAKQAWMKAGCDGGYAPNLYQAIASKSPKAVEDALKKAVYENFGGFDSCRRLKHQYGISGPKCKSTLYGARVCDRWHALGCESPPGYRPEHFRGINSCTHMERQYGIGDGHWGSADAQVRDRWGALGCDSAPRRSTFYYNASAALPGPAYSPNYIKGGDFTVLQYEPNAQHSFRVTPDIVQPPWNYPV